MIDLLNKKIIIAGREHDGVTYQCWWCVESLGLFATLDEVSAIIGPDKINLINLRPVTVAVASDGVFEPI